MPEPGAVAGVVWGGPVRLLGVLETALGLGGRYPSATQRAAALIPHLENQPASFFSESFKRDALAVARTLIRWRDLLCLNGWQGQGGTPRLDALSQATKPVLPGIPARIEAVLDALETRAADIESITCAEPTERLPALWGKLLDRLAGRGTQIEIMAEASTTGAGDLGRLAAGQPAEADGTVTLLRAPAPRQAAEALARWLAAQPDWDRTLIIGRDAVLDRALESAGLPALGAAEDSDNPMLEALPLALAMSWKVPDPGRALELVSLAGGPVPAFIGRRLAGTLSSWPAVGSPEWNKALTKGLGTIEDEDRCLKVELRLDLLFDGQAEGLMPASVAISKARGLAQWLRGKQRFGDESEAWRYEEAAAQCDAFVGLVESIGGEQLSDATVAGLLRAATAGLGGRPVRDAEAGIAVIDDPGLVLGPAARVIWWDFSRESVTRPRSELPLSSEELSVLEGQGVQLRDAASLARIDAERWRRPVGHATKQLMLVCPERGVDGESLHVHPLWDEITAGIDGEIKSRMVTRKPETGTAVSSHTPDLLELIPARKEWHVSAGSIVRRKEESASGIGGLIGCPLHWTLKYGAKLKRGWLSPLSNDALMAGSLAHCILEQVFEPGPAPTPADAAARGVPPAKTPNAIAADALPSAQQVANVTYPPLVVFAGPFS